MRASELKVYLTSLDGGWVDPSTTVDTFKSGDPETEVKGIAVGWQSYTWALEKAIQLGCNVFVTHEPTYYNHLDQSQGELYTDLPGYFEKLRFIQEQGLIILRCHDLWDQMPEIGVPDSWAEVLGLSRVVVRDGFYRVYEIPTMSTQQAAEQVAAAVKHLGQSGVEVIGSLDKPVQRVGIGTGDVTSLHTFIKDYQVDLAICTDDGFCYWRDGEYAVDQDISVIVVNHAVSEEVGIRNLARLIQGAFPLIPVHSIPQGCPYKLVMG